MHNKATTNVLCLHTKSKPHSSGEWEEAKKGRNKIENNGKFLSISLHPRPYRRNFLNFAEGNSAIEMCVCISDKKDEWMIIPFRVLNTKKICLVEVKMCSMSTYWTPKSIKIWRISAHEHNHYKWNSLTMESWGNLDPFEQEKKREREGEIIVIEHFIGIVLLPLCLCQ